MSTTEDPEARFDAFSAFCPSRRLLGMSLLDTIRHLKEWAEVHMPDVDAARAEYDRHRP